MPREQRGGSRGSLERSRSSRLRRVSSKLAARLKLSPTRTRVISTARFAVARALCPVSAPVPGPWMLRTAACRLVSSPAARPRSPRVVAALCRSQFTTASPTLAAEMPTTASVQLRSSSTDVPTGLFINNEWVSAPHDSRPGGEPVGWAHSPASACTLLSRSSVDSLQPEPCAFELSACSARVRTRVRLRS